MIGLDFWPEVRIRKASYLDLNGERQVAWQQIQELDKTLKAWQEYHRRICNRLQEILKGQQ